MKKKNTDFKTYGAQTLSNYAEDTFSEARLSIGANHTFSAKEKDAETGLSVTSLRSVSSSSLSQAQTSLTWRSLIRRFGSRYYSSDLSIWLSVDPMSDKYTSLSPYTYCSNNPIKLVDPNGEEVITNDQKNITMSEKLINTDPPKDIKNTSTFSDKLEKLEAKVHKVEVACAEGLAASIPISSTVNDIKILKDGEDLFGNQATKSDKTWAKVGLATLGAGSVVKLVSKVGKVAIKTTGKIIESVQHALNARSGFSTTIKVIKQDEEEQKKN